MMANATEEKSPRGAAIWPDAPPAFEDLPLPQQLLVPLSVRIGRDAKLKERGAKVRRGQSLVEDASEWSHVPVAPADGTLGNVRPIRLTTGRAASAIELTVENDSGNAHGLRRAQSSRDAVGAREITSLIGGLERIRASGVWADRHASPDLIGQLNQIIARPIDTLICTALDSDASLRLNAAIAANFAEEVVAGIEMLARITTARNVFLAVESFSSLGWIKPLWKATRDSRVRLTDLANDYPQSDPTLMVYSLTRRRLRPENLPTARGVMVIDAPAAMAIGEAVDGTPMLTVPVAVHDHVRRRSHFLRVPVGTTVEILLKPLGIDADEVMLRGGDLLRDLRLRRDAVIAGGELTLHATASERPVIPEPCIRCAWCIEACPTLVHPALVLDAAQRRDPKMADRAGIGACIECGVCAHVCPSRLPLLSAIRGLKDAK
jgi:electron transport complex protein RnfC